MNTRAPEYRTRLGAASAILGPALMSVGDLFHPAESWDPAIQVAILTDSASRWYAAHLLLFIGMLLFVPGILELTKLGAGRRPVAAHAARILLIISVGALSAVFVFEMVLGRFVSEGGGHAAAVTLLETFQSPQLFGALAPGLLAFFVGIALFVRSLAPLTPSFRWPAYALAFGAILILGEIILAQVLLSQIGNILMLVGGIGFARLLLRGQHHVPAF
jgi:hypothetical protein